MADATLAYVSVILLSLRTRETLRGQGREEAFPSISDDEKRIIPHLRLFWRYPSLGPISGLYPQGLLSGFSSASVRLERGDPAKCNTCFDSIFAGIGGPYGSWRF